jgi:hypothetical protein
VTGLVGVAATCHELVTAAVTPDDLQAWVLALCYAIFTLANGAIAVYHAIGRARRQEFLEWGEARIAKPAAPVDSPLEQHDT